MIKRKEEALRNPSNFYNWSCELWDDKDCVLAAVRQFGIALCNASDKLRADREVVLAAVQQNGDALLYASKDLRADREVVLAAVQQYGCALKFASDELRADRKVVLEAVRQDGHALLHASKDLRADREVVLAAVQQDARALPFADKALRQDEQFAAELADVCPLGIVWRYKPQVTSAETARRAMRSKKGLLLLTKQARVSLLGEPTLMKELLLSAMEQSCLEYTLQILIASQNRDIVDALRTVMAWRGVDVPDDLLTGLPPDSESAEVFCNTVLSALAGTCA